MDIYKVCFIAATVIISMFIAFQIHTFLSILKQNRDVPLESVTPKLMKSLSFVTMALLLLVVIAVLAVIIF